MIEIQSGASNTNLMKDFDFDCCKKWYSEADDQLRNRYNGIKILDSMRLMHSLVSAVSFRPREITKTVKNAIVSRFPANRYLVGLNAKLILRLLSYLPDKIVEKIYGSLY